jgi:hypothetical protein
MIDFVRGKIRSKKEKRIQRRKNKNGGEKRKDQNDILEHAAASDQLMTRNKRTGVGLESTTTPIHRFPLSLSLSLSRVSWLN